MCFLLEIELFCPVKQKRVSKLSVGIVILCLKRGDIEPGFFIFMFVSENALLTLYFACYTHRYIISCLIRICSLRPERLCFCSCLRAERSEVLVPFYASYTFQTQNLGNFCIGSIAQVIHYST